MDRRDPHRTQWAAQFAAASELCKQNYQIALTLGNHPEADLMVVSENKAHFVIDVKGQYKPGYWNIRLRRERSDLYYVLVYVPDGKPNQFFVLSHADAIKAGAADLKRRRDQRKLAGKSTEKLGIMPGFSWAAGLPFKDNWKALPR